MISVVTGATGYIGHNLTKRLLAKGETVIAIVRNASNVDKLTTLSGALSLCPEHEIDATLDFVRDAPFTVFHLAGQFSGNNYAYQTAVDDNLMPGVRLLDALTERRPACFVNAGSYWQFSSDGAVQPNSEYAAAKQAFQEILAFFAYQHRVPAPTTVLFDVYGPEDRRGKLIETLTTWDSETIIDMTNGEQLLDLIHIDDVVDALLAAAQIKEPGHCQYFAGSNQRRSLRSVVTMIEELRGITLPIRWGARPYPDWQIFDPCPAAPPPFGWQAKITLKAGLSHIIEGQVEQHQGLLT